MRAYFALLPTVSIYYAAHSAQRTAHSAQRTAHKRTSAQAHSVHYTAMPNIAFTPNIQRHVHCPPGKVSGGTVRDVLEAAFAGNERARGYVLDEQGSVRQHMVIFVNGQPIRDRTGLSDPVPPDGEVYVMQALSGG